ncbi:pyrimidine utilization transport protein G [Bosea caraganae]|uniref:Pyrimidine utilization transport protein G n=1 Tax=Bosea caraganae TaxID=2763117 RepID=A0A370LB19_9HYPH|nr:solute carrier family 23 protein [Bosea caraganae]RDJ27166.1 pyrimidine utilization transport protein G [Bosea caraganae]RDJ29183.1 pyrimidine utilization transport protein G [Bosea caraganae]
MGYFPNWTLKTSGAVMPDERLPTGQTIIAGLQHIVAMFGATVLAPVLMGFDPNVAILFSGIATLLFFVITRGRLPSYLGSSFAFIGVVIAASGYAGSGPNANIAVALGGIIACGALYFAIGLIVQAVGTNWIEKLLPPVVTGAVVAAIGLNLTAVAMNMISASPYTKWIALLTVIAVALVAVYGKGLAQRLPVLIGGLAAYLAYALTASSFGAPPIDFGKIAAAAWFGLPNFVAPVFDVRAMALIAPVAIILVAENLGHIKGIAVMTGRNFDSLIGRGFMADGLATMIAGSGGGTGVTTYAENMGVMAVTRVYSTLVFVAAGIIALVLGFSPKFGAVIGTIPVAVLGGLAIVVFGLIAATAGRIWVENKVDFSEPKNLLTVATALILGAGDLKLPIFGFELGGIGTATFGAIALYHLLNRKAA